MMRCFEELKFSRFPKRLFFSVLKAYPNAHLFILQTPKYMKMTLPSNQLLFSLSLFFLTSVCADYVVYPRTRNNFRLNSEVTDSINFYLGPENVQTFISIPRQVYEFWLIKATENQAVVLRNLPGVSSFPYQYGVGTDWNGCFTEYPTLGRRGLGE